METAHKFYLFDWIMVKFNREIWIHKNDVVFRLLYFQMNFFLNKQLLYPSISINQCIIDFSISIVVEIIERPLYLYWYWLDLVKKKNVNIFCLFSIFFCPLKLLYWRNTWDFPLTQISSGWNRFHILVGHTPINNYQYFSINDHVIQEIYFFPAFYTEIFILWNSVI